MASLSDDISPAVERTYKSIKNSIGEIHNYIRQIRENLYLIQGTDTDEQLSHLMHYAEELKKMKDDLKKFRDLIDEIDEEGSKDV